MEINEPIDITLKDASSIEGAKPLMKTDQKLKRVASEKQLNALQKAREQKAIKKKATSLIEMMDIQEEETETNYSSYILPFMGIIGSITGIYMLKKKISSYSTNTSKQDTEQSTVYSKLQLNF